jgi:hypothetical protein
MPKLVDSVFAQKIVTVTAKQVSDLLSVYLLPSEVQAAVERFLLVQEACRGILERHEAILPQNWNIMTAESQLQDGSNNSYLGKMAAGLTKHELVDPGTQTITAQIKDTPSVNRLKDLLYIMEPLVWSGILAIRECHDLLEVVIANVQAGEAKDRVPLLNNLKATAIDNWNTLLHHPPANPGVLLRTRPI